MNIKDTYLELTTRSLNLSDFNDILNFKNECKLQMNQEYLYLADILIIDLYINEGLYDDALNIANKLVNNIDNVVFQKIYVSLLERLIYIFIQKQNYKSAYRYAFMKRNFIDIENIDEINRWYLEMAYIYAELNQKDKALLNLKAILNNYPNDSLKALTLSNMTKLYIDQHQIEEAKEALNDCISLVYKLDDEEGILYCNYLNAKLSILEKNYKHAKHSFQDFFKNINTLTEDYLSIANEYIALLIDMDLYDEAYRFCIKHLKPFEDTKNLEVKKNFYSNYLKIHILKNKNTRDDVKGLLKAIEVIEKEIAKYDDLIINESNEDEKRIEIEDRINKLISKIEKTVTYSLSSIQNDTLRNSLINYSSSLEKHLNFDEVLYVIFPIDSFDVVLEANDNIDKILTFNYKKSRLYERVISFNNLESSIVEMIISQNHEIMLDLSDTLFDVKDVITSENYKSMGFNSVIAIPLFNNNELYGCAIYLSKTNSLANLDSMTNLKIATKLLEGKLINLHYEENIRTLKAMNNLIGNSLNFGVFYLKNDFNNIILPSKLQEFLNLENRKLSVDEFAEFIVKEDRVVRELIKTKLENVEEYSIEYRLFNGGNQYLVKEKAYPYITKDGILKFYYGVIEFVRELQEHEKDSYYYLNKDDFENDFHEILKKAKDLDYKASFLKFKIKNINSYSILDLSKFYDQIYRTIRRDISKKVYNFNESEIMVIVEDADSKELEKNVKILLNELDKGIQIDNKILKFDVKVGVVRFPIDTYNLKEVIEYCDVALESNERYQPFNEKVHKIYIKRKSINSCVYEHIKKNSIELLSTPLHQRGNVAGYLVNYNINGLEDVSLLNTYVSNDVLSSFEKLVFNTLMNGMKKQLPAKFYLKLSLDSVKKMLSEKVFSKSNMINNRSIVFVLDEIDANILTSLENYQFGIILTNNSFNSINLNSLLNNNYIRGVLLDSELNKNMQELFNALNYEIISFKEISNYTNVKVIGNEKIKLVDLFK